MKKLTICLLLSILYPAIRMNAQYDELSIDSLERMLEHPPEKERDLYMLYIELSFDYLSIDLEKALDYARQGIHLARERDNPYWMAEFYYMEGDAFYYLGKPDSAMHSYTKCLELQRQAMDKGEEDKQENDQLTLNLFNAIANIHALNGEHDKALEAYLRILPIADKKANSTSILTYGNLASIYFQMSNHEQAEYYYLKQKQLSAGLKDSAGMADANMGLIPVLTGRGEYTKALEYGEEAYKLFLSQPEPSQRNLTNAAMRLSEIWIKIPDYAKAMKYAEATVHHARQTGYPSFLASALYTLSTAYLRQGKYAECEQAAFEALGTDSTNLYVNSILYANIAQACIRQGDKDKAIEYFGKTLDANRAFSNRNFQASLSEMEVKYETLEKELRITKLEKEKQLIAWLGISGAVILLFVLLLFLFLWRWSVREKKLIATQAVLEGETAERTRLARDLHDGLGSMLTGVKLNLETINNGASQSTPGSTQVSNTLEMLNESIIELRRIAHHLMPDSLSRYGLKTALTDFCNNFPSIHFDYFGSEGRLDSKLEIMIYRIIHELVNNALKHSGAKEVIVELMRETDYVAFIVRDNGSGFDPSSLTTGIGLKNIRDRVTAFGGRMEVHSKAGEGTEINIELKINN